MKTISINIMEQKTIITNRKFIIYKKGANNTVIFTSRPDKHKNETLIPNPNYKNKDHDNRQN